jgi:mono/diheme cytochrome c family protein
VLNKILKCCQKKTSTLIEAKPKSKFIITILLRMKTFPERLIVRTLACLLILFVSACSSTTENQTEVNKLMFHNDPQNTGWNPNETVLTPKTVANSGLDLLWNSPKFDSLDGTEPRLFASPLYVENLEITEGQYAGYSGSVVFAASSNGFVYAVSAERVDETTAGTILWRRQLIEEDGCRGNRWGLLSTPVIDLDTRRIYAVTCENQELFKAHALDVGSGHPEPDWPVAINHTTVNQPGINNNGTAQFPDTMGDNIQRGALNLGHQGSRLYVPFGGTSSPGFLVAIDTQQATVATAFSATATTEEAQGGIWASGGAAIDPEGRIHVATGANVRVMANNLGLAGIFPDSTHNWGQSIIQLTDSGEEGLELTGTYTPFDYCDAQIYDIDMGSTGPIAIALDPETTSTPHLLGFVGGKQGMAYLLDRDNMPGSLVKRPPCSDDPGTDMSLLAPDDQPPFGEPGPINVFGPYSVEHGAYDLAKSRTTGAYFRSDNGNSYLFGSGSSKASETSPESVPPGLVRLNIVTEPGQPAFLRVDQFEETLALLNAGSPVISSNKGQDAILWVLDLNARRTVPLWGDNPPQPVLYALDSLTFEILWQSNVGDLYTSGKYNEPTIVNGTVFVGTDRIQAFGLRDNSSTSSIEKINVQEREEQSDIVESEAEPKATLPTSSDTVSISQGRTLYNQRCAQCHDSDKFAGLPSREQLSQFPHEHIVFTLRNGVMQIQADGLTTEQLNAIASYLTHIENEG